MHVGFVVYGGLDETSGGFRYDRRLVEYLRECGDTVDVISLPWRRYWRAVADGLDPRLTARLDRPVDVLVEDELCHPSLWRQNHRLTQPRAVVALVHLVQSADQHGWLPQLRRRIARGYLDSVDGVIATSEYTRKQARGLGADLGECVVAPPAGRTEGAAVTEPRVRQRASDGPLRIAYVGNLLPRKDLMTLLAAVDRTERRHGCTDWQLTVVGSHAADPEYAETAVDRVQELGIDDRVEFRGEVPEDELTAVLETSHVLCVPSRYEGFGMVYLEAMEYGVVPIGSARGGAGEFISDGDNGALVDPGDADRIAALLAEWATDRDRLAALGVSALDTAATHPRWEETFASVRSLLQSVSAAEGSPLANSASTPERDDSAIRGGQP